MMTKIDEIVTKEALEQVDLMIAKLKTANMLQKRIGDNVCVKVIALTDLLKIDYLIPPLRDNAMKKLSELIPLL